MVKFYTDKFLTPTPAHPSSMNLIIFIISIISFDIRIYSTCLIGIAVCIIRLLKGAIYWIGIWMIILVELALIILVELTLIILTN